MSIFALSEQKSLVFHQVIMGLIGNHPNLITRAVAELSKFRSRKAEQMALWDRWAALLDLPLEEMAPHVLADTADGGLLRANSPFTVALSKPERNAIWQRIGLMQFTGHYFGAAADLALDLAEQSVIIGVTTAELTAWQKQRPQEMTKGVLDRLKQVVALHKALSVITSDQEVRRRWLRSESPTLAALPLSLMMEGKAAQVLESLAGAAQLVLSPDDLPRIGNA